MTSSMPRPGRRRMERALRPNHAAPERGDVRGNLRAGLGEDLSQTPLAVPTH